MRAPKYAMRLPVRALNLLGTGHPISHSFSIEYKKQLPKVSSRSPIDIPRNGKTLDLEMLLPYGVAMSRRSRGLPGLDGLTTSYCGR
jgi:hypothetical protein